MALTKIRLANKKAKREAKRKTHRADFIKERREATIRNKRMRGMMIEGRRQDLKQRQGQIAYVKQLEAEAGG